MRNEIEILTNNYNKNLAIGILGEGNLVSLISEQLLNSRYSLNILDSQKIENIEGSVFYFNSIRSLISASKIVITIAADGPELERLLFDDEGISNSSLGGRVIIDMSPVSPEFIQEISEQLIEKDISFLDAAIINEQKDQSGALQMLLVGGEKSVYEKTLPIFQSISKSVKYLGANGASQFYRQAFGVRKKLS